MDEEERMNGQVPQSPVLRYFPGIPPVEIKASIRESQDFGDSLTPSLEHGHEHNDPRKSTGHCQSNEETDFFLDV